MKKLRFILQIVFCSDLCFVGEIWPVPRLPFLKMELLIPAMVIMHLPMPPL